MQSGAFFGTLLGSASTSASFLLDTIAAAKMAAFSTRKLRAAYTGACLQARRNSDGALLDIGFDANGNFDLATFTGWSGGTAQAVKFYDQTGNGNHAVNSANNDNVPYLQFQNTLVTIGANGRQAMHFFHNSTQNRSLSLPTVTLASPPSVIAVLSNTDATYVPQCAITFIGSSDAASNATNTSLQLLRLNNGTASGLQNGAQLSSATYAMSKCNQFSSVFTATSNTVSVNNGAGGAVAWNNSLGAGHFVIGAPSSNEIATSSVVVEVMLLSGTVSTADATAAYSNQLAYYGAPA